MIEKDEFIKKVQKMGFEIQVHEYTKHDYYSITIGDGERTFVKMIPKCIYAINTMTSEVGGFYITHDTLPLMELYELCFEFLRSNNPKTK